MKKLIYLMFLFLFYSSGFSSEVLNLRLVGDHAEVRFQSLSNKQYKVEFSEDLKTWNSVVEEIVGTGSEVVVTHELAGRSKGFYQTMRSDEFTLSISSSLFDIGNEWTYSVTENENGTVYVYTEVTRINGTSLQNGIPVFNVASYSNETTWIGAEYIQQDISEGLFAVGLNDPAAGKMFSTPPEPLLYRQFVPGIQMPPLGMTFSDPDWGPATIRVTTSIEYGALTVPEGTFVNTIKVEKQISGTVYDMDYIGGATTWYAMDVGIVKSTTSISIPDAEYEFTTASKLTSYNLN